MISRLLAIVLVMTASLLWLNESAAEEADQTKLSRAALLVFSGNDSHISEPAYLRIESATEWKKHWLKHLGLKHDTIYRPSIEIDFNRCVVIAILGGNSFNSCGYRVESVREGKDAVVVRFDDISYQTAGPDGGADRVTPYAFIVLPMSQRPVVLEENVQNLLVHPPIWKEVARLNATGR